VSLRSAAQTASGVLSGNDARFKRKPCRRHRSSRRCAAIAGRACPAVRCRRFFRKPSSRMATASSSFPRKTRNCRAVRRRGECRIRSPAFRRRSSGNRGHRFAAGCPPTRPIRSAAQARAVSVHETVDASAYRPCARQTVAMPRWLRSGVALAQGIFVMGLAEARLPRTNSRRPRLASACGC